MKRTISILCFSLFICSCSQQKVYDTIIRNGIIYDGTGGQSFKADIGINADTIAFIGDLSKASSDKVVDAKGKFITPGFIDSHSHHDRNLGKNRNSLANISQGVTTIITGQDGFSQYPLATFFKQVSDTPIAINIASYSGHNTLREIVLGKNFQRTATVAEVEKMKTMFRKEMEAGAMGFSTGLEYDPGIYSSKEEVLEIAKEAKLFNGRYISHIRSEDRYFWKAIEEIIEIGRQASIPVQISHVKLAMQNLWGKSDSLLHLIEAARKEGIILTCDIYPYDYWHSTIRVLFPKRNFTNEKEASLILKEITLPEDIIIGFYELQPEYEGKTLAEIATIENKTASRMLIELIARIEAWELKINRSCKEGIMARAMNETDIQKLMAWPFTSICSDGSNSGKHPRGYGSFTRVLNKYVKETKTLKWEEAIYKMSGLAASQMGIKKRGLLKQGCFADVVVLTSEKVRDLATIKEPQKISEGIEKVWVNGKIVFENNQPTGNYPGKIILRQ